MAGYKRDSLEGCISFLCFCAVCGSMDSIVLVSRCTDQSAGLADGGVLLDEI